MERAPDGYQFHQDILVNNGTLYIGSNADGVFVAKGFNHPKFTAASGKLSRELQSANDDASAFLQKMNLIYSVFRRHCRIKGNLNVPYDVVRKGVQIFKVSRYVEDCGVPARQLHEKLSVEQIDVLAKTVLLQLEKFEELQFIHSDMKPDNVVVSQNGDIYYGSIIDYEDGFFVSGIPDAVSIIGTPEYASPELFFYIGYTDPETGEALKHDSPGAKALGCASNMFSMACIYAYYLCGVPLGYTSADKVTFIPPGEALCNNLPLRIHPAMDCVHKTLLQQMLQKDPSKRLCAAEAVQYINQAARAGLFGTFAEPFPQTLKSYQVTDRPVPGFPENVARIAAKGNARAIAVHLDTDWLPPQLPQGELYKAMLWQKTRGKRCRQRRAATGRIVARLSASNPSIARFELPDDQNRAFALVEMPQGRAVPLDALHDEFPSLFFLDLLMYDLLAAVDALHQSGLVHGTIAPGSVWFFYDETERHIRVADAYAAFPRSDLPMPEDFLSFPVTVSPEVGVYIAQQQCPGESGIASYIGPASDVYSLGFLYHVLLTGQLPEIEGMTEEPFYSSMMRNPSGPSALRLNPVLDEDHLRIIRGMLCVEPAGRYQNCMDAANAIIDLHGRPELLSALTQ